MFKTQFQSPLEQEIPSITTTPSEENCLVSGPTPATDYHSQFVKEGLKMKVTKNIRRTSEDSQSSHLSIKRERDDFTPENDEKRRRRRERNKIAAEKCRNKRKAAIEKLYSESESVAVQNSKYKEDIAKLEAEQRYWDSNQFVSISQLFPLYRHLRMVLEQHKPVCRRLLGVKSSPDSSLQQVKTEKEDSDIFADREENFENVYKYDLYDGVHNNFAYTGSYYDTACLAI